MERKGFNQICFPICHYVLFWGIEDTCLQTLCLVVIWRPWKLWTVGSRVKSSHQWECALERDRGIWLAPSLSLLGISHEMDSWALPCPPHHHTRLISGLRGIIPSQTDTSKVWAPHQPSFEVCYLILCCSNKNLTKCVNMKLVFFFNF